MNKASFTLATCNLMNLNLGGRPMYQDTTGWSPEQYAAKVAWLGRALAHLDADVFGLQEVWDAAALADVLTAGSLTDRYDVLATPAVGTKIVCAALVRKGLLVAGSASWIDAFPEATRLQSTVEDAQTPDIDVRIVGFSRPVLRFQVAWRDDQRPTSVYVAHLKSKAPAPVYKERWFHANPTLFAGHTTALGSALATIRRTAEATALRIILNLEMKGGDTPVIVLGDLNDGQLSNTLNILTGQPQYLVGDSLGGGDTALYAGQTLQEYRDIRDVYYTHVHQSMRESLDHVLVSEQFYDHSRKRLWLFEGLTIDNDHLNQDDHKTDGSTDHGLVKARFRYKPAKA